MSSKSKTILITGANRGIGLALTELALAQEWHVIAAARRTGKKEALALLAAQYPGRLLIETLDVTDPVSIAALAGKLSSMPIDVLVNNAGTIGPTRQSTLETDFEGFKNTFDVNTLGPLRVSQAFLPHLRAAQKISGMAKIAAISSAMGRMSYAKSDHIAYRASKAALNKVMQGLATDLAPENIIILILHPGWVRTDMGGAEADIDPQTSAAGILGQITEINLQRTGAFLDYRGNVILW